MQGPSWGCSEIPSCRPAMETQSIVTNPISSVELFNMCRGVQEDVHICGGELGEGSKMR